MEELTEELDRWNAEVCDTHIVQKVGRSPLEIFEQEEVAALRPLPPSRWDPVILQGGLGGPGLACAIPESLLLRALSVDRPAGPGHGQLHHGARVSRRRGDHDAPSGHTGLAVRVESRACPSADGAIPGHVHARAAHLGLSAGAFGAAVTQRIFADKAVDGLRPARALDALGATLWQGSP